MPRRFNSQVVTYEKALALRKLHARDPSIARSVLAQRFGISTSLVGKLLREPEYRAWPENHPMPEPWRVGRSPAQKPIEDPAVTAARIKRNLDDAVKRALDTKQRRGR